MQIETKKVEVELPVELVCSLEQTAIEEYRTLGGQIAYLLRSHNKPVVARPTSPTKVEGEAKPAKKAGKPPTKRQRSGKHASLGAIYRYADSHRTLVALYAYFDNAATPKNGSKSGGVTAAQLYRYCVSNGFVYLDADKLAGRLSYLSSHTSYVDSVLRAGPAKHYFLTSAGAKMVEKLPKWNGKWPVQK